MDDRAEWERVLDEGGDFNAYGEHVGHNEWRKLLNRYGGPVRAVEPSSYAERHVAEVGHSPSFGCCAQAR